MFRVRWFSSALKFRDVESLPIPADLKVSLKGLGVSRLTRIQSECFPLIMGGKSCLGIARTGEGKTLAYMLPTLARMMTERMLDASRTTCVIVVPTKDLCQQVGSVLVSLVPTVSILLAYGKPSESFGVLLRQKPHVLIGTGGRIASLVKRDAVDLKSVKIMIFDELDSMLIPDYCKEVTPLLESLTRATQVVGIGASYSPELQKLLSKFTAFSESSQILTLGVGNQTPDKITHSSIKVPDSIPLRISVAAALLESRVFSQALVFVKNEEEAKAVSHHPLLVSKSRVLHGNLPQAERERTLNLFRAGSLRILVSTDVVSRGLDIEGVDLVISLSPPNDDTVYLHRCGRTGRAGRRGESLVLYSQSEKEIIDAISKSLNFSFLSETCPSKQKIRQVAVSALVQQALDRRITSERFPKLSARVSNLSLEEKSALVTACMKALLGSSFNVSPPKFSILSGKRDFTPVLFVDPAKSYIANRAEVLNLIEKLDLSPGLVAWSESGFIVDLPTSSAFSICNQRIDSVKQAIGIEPVIPERLPRIVPEGPSLGRKFRSTLPWRRLKKKPLHTSDRF